MLFTQGDTILTVLFSIGLFQFFWFSVALVRKGFSPSLVRLSLLSLLSIWILAWPAYEDTKLIPLSLSLLFIPFLFALHKTNSFARHLRLAWHTSALKHRQPAPWLMFSLSLLIGANLFHLAPELGFGLSLSLCLGWTAAEFIDRTGRGIRLGFTNNLKQTLAGHLVLVLATSFICAWGLQIYHNTEWQQFYIATLIVGLSGSVARGIIPSGWNMPVATLTMSIALWLL